MEQINQSKNKKEMCLIAYSCFMSKPNMVGVTIY